MEIKKQYLPLTFYFRSDNIFKKEIEYSELCKKYKIENGFTEENMSYVHEIYRKCKRERKFLEYEEREDY